MKIGNLTFENNVFLAPMAGVTDISFRGLCKEMGCGLVYTEMVSAKALYYGSDNTKALLRIADEEKPVAVQIFGREPEIMAKMVEEHFNHRDDICIIDINMGCPAPKLVKNGDGAGLLLDLKNVEGIIKEAVKVSNKPITVKTRKGFNEEKITAIEVAKIAEENGVSFITIHGRTREEYYSGKSDLDIIKKVKESVNIPVIGNGDIVDFKSAYHMFEYTGCDGIMIARGAQGNPWIFKSILNGKDYKPDLKELFDTIYNHINYQVEYDEEKQANLKLRKHIAWYLKGLNGSSKIRDEINKSESIEHTKEILNKYYNELKN